MKTLLINRKGALWRLATFYGSLKENDVNLYGTDVCTFTKSAALGFFRVMAIIAIASLLAACVGDALGWIVVGLQTSHWVMVENAGLVGLAILGAATCLVLLPFFGLLLVALEPTFARFHRRESPSKPSALREMYEAWKDKVCFQVRGGDTYY